MPTDIDSLQIQINAQASKANDAIDRLVGKIDKLTTSLAKVDGSKITGLANGVQRLGTAMQTMNTVKTADFTRLATNLTKLGSVNASALNSAASSMSHLTRAFNNLGTVSVNATAVGDLAKNIGKLGNKSVQTAVVNIPQLATALNGLMTTLSQAPRVSQNVIQMTNALANLSAQGSKVGSASSSIVKGLNRASSSATSANKSFKGLASTFGKFYANCFSMIRGLKGLWNSINSTADYLEAFNYFEVALNKVGGDWAGDYEKYGYANAEEYANSFKTRLNESLKGLSGVQISIDSNGETGLLTNTGLKNLGLNIQEVTQYASQLASVTNSVGQTGEVTLATASAFTKLGADMSSLFNVDYSSVMNNLQSGLIGQSRALYKYGIDITNATLQTYAYELGVEKAVSEMTQAEKMQLRMIAILDQSRVAWGDQANTINSLSNSIRQFKNNISEAGQILGQLFVPIMSKLMPIINGVVIAIKRLMVSIAGLFGIKLDLSEFGQSTSGVSEEIGGISDSLDDVSESAKKAKAGLRGFDELNVINTPSDSGGGTSGSVGGGGIDLTDGILKATEEYEKAWQEAYDRMENKAEKFANFVSEKTKFAYERATEGFWGSFESSPTKLIGNIERIGETAKNVFNSEKVKKSLEELGEQAITTYGSAAGAVSSVEISVSTGLSGGIANAQEELENFNKEKIASTSGNVTKSLKGIEDVNSATAKIGAAFESEGFQGIIEFLTTIADVSILNSLELVTGLLSDLFGLISEPIVENADKINGILEKIFEIASNLLEPIQEFISTIANSSGTYENSFLHKLLGGEAKSRTEILGSLLDLISEKLDAICEISKTVGEALGNFFTNSSKKITEAKEKITEFLDVIKNTWGSLSSWFNETVVTPVSTLFQELWETVKQIFEGLWIIIQAIWIVVSEIVEKIGNLFSELWNAIKKIWGNVSDWFEKTVLTPLLGKFGTACDSIGKKFEPLWRAIKKGIGSAMNTVINTVESSINFIVKGINGIIGGFNKIVTVSAKIVGADWSGVSKLTTVSLGRINVNGYEAGGFPKQYSMFMAGENGVPEMLGTVGGKTAVAGGAEITGISDTIRATSNEEMVLLRQQNALLQAILEKEYGISKDDIGKAAQSWARDYSRRTGREAYSF